jgi:RNA polymerase sigma-70 factor, ECF subfamily
MRHLGAETTDHEAEAASGVYERLFRQEGERMWRTLFAFTGGRGDIAEEAVAEAFARAMATKKALHDPLRWMYRTAFHVAIDEVRRERRDGQNVVSPAPGSSETYGELIWALGRLSPNQRAAVVMRYEAGLPIDEIAGRLGITSATVRVHLHRGRRRLRELLGSKEEDDD